MTLGFTGLFLTFIVLIPLAELILRAGSLPLEELWRIATEPRALASGADDDLSKPFSPKILIAQAKALLRRAAADAADAVAVGGLSLDVPELNLLGLPNAGYQLDPSAVSAGSSDHSP